MGGTTIELHYNPDGQHIFKDTIKLNVFEVDLDADGVADEGELDPGAYVAVNDDDDNGNGTADKDDTGVVTGEDDLVKITLDVHRPEGVTVPGSVTLVRELGGDKVNVWTSDRSTSAGTKLTFNGQDNVFPVASLPVDLWVEGKAVSGSLRDIRLALSHTNAYVTQRDQVCSTVFWLRFASPTPEEDEVHLKGEEIRWRGELDPPGLPGVSWLFSYLQGTGDPGSGPGSPAGDGLRDFDSTATSEGGLELQVEVAVGSTTFDTSRAITTVVPRPVYLNFKGASNTRIKNIGTTPEWTEEDQTTYNYAVYDKATTAWVEARFEADLSLTDSTLVRVRGFGNKENFAFDEVYFHNWEWHPDECYMQSSELYQSINFYDTLDVTWKYIVRDLAGGWPSWSNAVTMGGSNPTSHILYTVMKPPVKRDRSGGRGHDAYTKSLYDRVCRTLEGYMGDSDDYVAENMMQWLAQNRTWTGNCHCLAAELAAFCHTQGVPAYQWWLEHPIYGDVGDYECQKTISIDPIGPAEARQYIFNFHSFNHIAGSVYDPTTNTMKAGWSVQQYEDWVMLKYAKCLRDYLRCWARLDEHDPPDPEDPQYEWLDNSEGVMEPDESEEILWEWVDDNYPN